MGETPNAFEWKLEFQPMKISNRAVPFGFELQRKIASVALQVLLRTFLQTPETRFAVTGNLKWGIRDLNKM